MLKKQFTFLLTSLLFIVGCASTSPAKVDFDKNSKVETINYKTFAWLNETKIMAAPQGINPIVKVRIDEAIENAFKVQGYQLIDDAENADFAISYTVGNRDRIKVNSYPVSYRRGYGGWGRGYYGGVGTTTQTSVRQYTEGKLAIDVYDVKTHQPAWHGFAVKRITDTDRENAEQTIYTIVNQVVAQFR
jgi:hypothetical protein